MKERLSSFETPQFAKEARLDGNCAFTANALTSLKMYGHLCGPLQ